MVEGQGVSEKNVEIAAMRIGELADRTGLTTKTLRFYEGGHLIPPPNRSANGYRDYPTSAVRRVEFIRASQSAGLTLVQIRSILDVRDSGQAPCEHVAALVDTKLAEVDQRIAELEQTRRVLQNLSLTADELDPTQCNPDDICRIITPT